MGYHTVISGGLSSLPVTLVRELKQIRICEDRCRPLHSRAFKDPRATDQDLLLMRQIRCVDVKGQTVVVRIVLLIDHPVMIHP